MDYGPSLMATLEVGDTGQLRLQGDRRAPRHRAGRRVARPALDAVRPRHAARRGGVERRGVHRLERHQLQRPAPGPPARRRARCTSPTRSAPAGPTRRPAASTTRACGAATASPTARCRARGPSYRGLYHYGNQVILSYTVGDAESWRCPPTRLTAERARSSTSRTLNVGKSSRDLLMRVAPDGDGRRRSSATGRRRWRRRTAYTLLHIPAAATPVALKLLLSDGDADGLRAFAKTAPPPASLEPFTKGGPRRWPEVLKTQAVVGGGRPGRSPSTC